MMLNTTLGKLPETYKMLLNCLKHSGNDYNVRTVGERGVVVQLLDDTLPA